MREKIEIIFADEAIVVVNKPAGLLTIPDRFVREKPNLVHALQSDYPNLFIVHRLDKDTSGIICFALQAEVHRDLSIQFEKRKVEKHYLALVEGGLLQSSGQIDRPIAPHPTVAGKMMPSAKGKAALTIYREIERYRQFSLVDAEIKTGRMHQIRVHFSAIGHPLAVDPLYGKRAELYLSEIKLRNFRLGRTGEERPLMSRLSLHAHSLKLHHPLRQETMSWEAPLPKDFRAVLNQLKKWGI